MKHTYTLEKWQNHKMVECRSFESKREAKSWLKKSSWLIDYDYGYCFINILVDGKPLPTDKKLLKWFKGVL